jgi:hypothetical protein
MMNIRLITRRLLIPIVTLLFMGAINLPTLAFADSSSPSTTPSSTTTPVVPPAPVGPCGTDYTYNAKSGLWEGQYYNYDPIAKVFTPLTALSYTYDSSANDYTTSEWECDARTGNYDQTTVTVTTPPAGADVVNPPSGNGVSSDPESASTPLTNVLASPIVPASGLSTAALTNSNNTTDTNNNNLGESTTVTDGATSGDASVLANVNAGDAVTGDADNDTTVENLLQSASVLPQGDTFTENINGDVNGDILINPAAIGSSTVDNTNNLTVGNTTNATLNNNIDLTAQSGDADVSENTTSGNATSGNADSVANVVNMIDSMISAGQSFVGVVNIYGNLNGNIVVPPQFINELLADNVPTTTINSSQITNQNIVTNLDAVNNQAISNNITTTAKSGQANVSENTTAGSATTGSSNTNVTVFNLTGDQIIGANTLLVFVNVLGNWVGLLMNTPAGTTAAAYGGGLTQDTTNSNTDVSSTNNDQINNNIDVASQSGDASVTKNTNAGSATSGNASSSVNLLNFINTQFSLSNWFGVLFINVFGTWNGSFGDQTTQSEVSSLSSGSSAPNSSLSSQLPALSFVPSKNYSLSSTGASSSGLNNNFTLASYKANKSIVPSDSGTVLGDNSVALKSHNDSELFFGGIVLLGLSIFGVDHLVSRRSKK